MVQRNQRFFPALAAFVAALSLTCTAATATAAPPPLTPSIVGETPTGSGVFRFPQAVGVDSHDGGVFVGDQYTGQIQKFTKAGVPLFSFGSLASRVEPGRLNVVGGVSVDRSGHVYVLDTDNDRVQIYSARTGQFMSTFGDRSLFYLFAGSRRMDHGITASGMNVFQAGPTAPIYVYVADSGNSRVTQIVLDPKTLKPVGAPRFNTGLQLQWPQGVATDPTGKRVYVADNQNHRVVVLDAATMMSTAVVGVQGTGPGQFNAPYDVAVDRGTPQRLYVADNLNGRVNVFDAVTLDFLGTYGGNGHQVGKFSIVRAIGTSNRDKAGGVVVADTANNRIQSLDREGNVVAAWGVAGRGPGYVTRARDVTVRPGGGIAVADTFDSRVEMFDPSGSFAGQLGPISRTGFAAPGDTSTRFLLPQGVAYDGAGNAWVSDTGNDRVKRYDAAGNVTLVTPADQFVNPRGITTDADGNAYVADSGQGSVVQITPAGTSTVVRDGLRGPLAMASDPSQDGAIYVATTATIVAIATKAKVKPPAPATTWDHLQGLAFGPEGTVYVSEARPKTPNGARVLRGTPDGNGDYVWDTIATEGTAAGQVIDPAGLAVSQDGSTLYVADAGNNRIQRFDAPGYVAGRQVLLTTEVVGGVSRGGIASPTGIDCATDCFQHVTPGTPVTLTVTAYDGSLFDGWTGACAEAGKAPTCTITVNDDTAVAARFTPVPPPPVRIRATTVRPARWHLARKAVKKPKRAAQKATRGTVVVQMTQPGKVALSLLVGKPGQKAARGLCVAPKTRSVAPKKRCTRFPARKGKRTLTLQTGRTVIPVATRFAGKNLQPGVYRFSLKATDAQGNTSTKLTPTFRVTK